MIDKNIQIKGINSVDEEKKRKREYLGFYKNLEEAEVKYGYLGEKNDIDK